MGRIAWRQAVMGGFIASPPPTPEASKDEDNDDDATASDDDDDGDASSSSADEMFTWHFYPLSLVTKRMSSFWYENSHF